MSENFTKSMARNMFYGGAVFFFLLFVGLTFDTMRELPKRDHRENITPEVARGKMLWEVNDCIGCHSLLGEGAYFAPELGNVYVRFGHNKQAIMAFIKSRPVNGIEGRRSMPQFNFSDEDLNDIAEFLKWTSEINSAGWPPNVQG
ncbi:Nitric-oxide reductase subunit C [hydrothermal vent metagenome]|uniref:Nitric-oxide reductase subunit C n=1 Tax=hydrothermal vent metagenome TaxID=652676 RepID=A0A3B1BPR3_9ZZZZ